MAIRVIGIEYLQNLPILAGLMLALRAENWLTSLALVIVGAGGTALTISLTERYKLGKTTPEKSSDVLVNALVFAAGSALYLAYFRLIRGQAANPLLIDGLAGLILGLVIGVMQGLGVGERRFRREDGLHTLGFMSAGCILCLMIGLVADVWPPMPAALLLCVPMTLIIVRMDYWTLIQS